MVKPEFYFTKPSPPGGGRAGRRGGVRAVLLILKVLCETSIFITSEPSPTVAYYYPLLKQFPADPLCTHPVPSPMNKLQCKSMY